MVFSEIKIKNKILKNRLVMSPMCMYSAKDGFVNEFHISHYGERAKGNIGLIILEASAVEKRGVISNSDLGIYKDEHIDGLRKLVNFCKSFGSLMGIQLAHAGRKAYGHEPWEVARGKRDFGIGEFEIIAPSPIAFANGWKVPKEMSKEDIEEVKKAFVNASIRALEAGFDVIELHAAHGYLINQFLSPISNKRTDEYGGSLENRARFLIEIIREVKKEIKDKALLFVRISATDWAENGFTIEDSIELCKKLKEEDVDVIDVSSGGILPNLPPDFYRGYQIPFSEKIKKEVSIKTMAVGSITTYEQALEIIKNERADLVCMGRALLKDPYIALRFEEKENKKASVIKQYERGWH